MVCRNRITARSHTGPLRVILWLGIDQLIEPRDMLLRSDPPNPFWRGRWRQFDPVRELTKQEIVIQKITLVRIKMSLESALILHDPLKLTDNPI